MDILDITKVWEDDNLVEIRIYAKSELASAKQTSYIEIGDLESNGKKILEYIDDGEHECYVVFGNKDGNFTPAFSLKMFPVDAHGHIKTEVDIEIDDNDERIHRSVFYVNSELGQIEELGKKLMLFAKE